MSAAPRRANGLWLSMAVLFAFFLVRTLSLESFPPFIDEMVHVRLAEQSLEISPVAFAAEGRLFTLWLQMLFQPHQAGTIWLMRAVQILALLPGFAAAVAIGRSVAGRTGALLAGFVLLASPMHMFFERLALGDTLASAWIVVAVFFAVRSAERFHRLGAMACGLALFIAIMFKASVLPALALLPLGALFLFRSNVGLGARIRWLAHAAFPLLILLGLAQIALRIANQDHFALIGHYMTAARTSLIERVAPNVSLVAQEFGAYLLPLLAGMLPLVLFGMIRRAPHAARQSGTPGTARRVGVFLLTAFLIMLAAYVANERPYTRYFLPSASLGLLLMAVILAPWLASARLGRARVVWIALIGVALLYPLAFALTAYRDPAAMPLSAADVREYMSSSASGFGLAEAVDVLRQRNPERVIGVLPNCQALRFLAVGAFAVECPRVNPNGEEREALSALMAQSRSAGVYVVHEILPYLPSSVPGQAIARFSRPGSNDALTVYDLGREP